MNSWPPSRVYAISRSLPRGPRGRTDPRVLINESLLFMLPPPGPQRELRPCARSSRAPTFSFTIASAASCRLRRKRKTPRKAALLADRANPHTRARFKTPLSGLRPTGRNREEKAGVKRMLTDRHSQSARGSCQSGMRMAAKRLVSETGKTGPVKRARIYIERPGSTLVHLIRHVAVRSSPSAQ